MKIIILISLCLPPSLCVQTTDVPPSMELYNETHRKVYFENSFYHLPEKYIAEVSIFVTNPTGGFVRIRREIINNFIEFEPCEVKDKTFFTVLIYEDEQSVREDNSLETSKEFYYTPGNNVNKILNTVQPICKLHRDRFIYPPADACG